MKLHGLWLVLAITVATYITTSTAHASVCSQLVERLSQTLALPLTNPEFVTGNFLTARLEEINLDAAYAKLALIEEHPAAVRDFRNYLSVSVQILEKHSADLKKRIPLNGNTYINQHSTWQRFASYLKPNDARTYRQTNIIDIKRNFQATEAALTKLKKLQVQAEGDYQAFIEQTVDFKTLSLLLEDFEFTNEQLAELVDAQHSYAPKHPSAREVSDHFKDLIKQKVTIRNAFEQTKEFYAK